ncbi:hypothetical protein LCGC14_2097790 [marine sediment metagenome]|uniref:Uncharacterized protein n=1 Tax=marine sediment metagenome TaxID=412755 RepID=A0A0F9GP19_9ZZZZ
MNPIELLKNGAYITPTEIKDFGYQLKSKQGKYNIFIKNDHNIITKEEDSLYKIILSYQEVKEGIKWNTKRKQ